jgi:uncharacterized SAM-binding protein YcdF (DUF218 family)
MASPTSTIRPPRGRARFAILLAVLLAVLAVAAVAFRDAGRWLVRPDPPARADAIVVLSGAMPARAEEAARLFGMGYSPEVWITRPVSPAAELASMGISYVDEAEYSRQVLIHEGVPAQSIRILPDTIVDTQQEVEETGREARAAGDRTVLFVTSSQHTRRVKALWRRIEGQNPAAIVCAAPQDSFDADHWWRNTHDAFAVVREFMGLLNVWTGLRVRPSSG